MKMTLSVVVASIFILMFNNTIVHAQESQVSMFQNRAAQYLLGDKDQILMNVNVWGYVARPGQYLVPRNTDLISLVSFAGGPRRGANLSNVHIIRGGVQVVNKQVVESKNGKNGHSKGKSPILVVNVKDHLDTGNVSAIPVLQAGDTIIISQTFGDRFKNALGFSSVIGILAATASLVVILERLNN